jgi:glucose-6-phosphate 1-dehydrogenase
MLSATLEDRAVIFVLFGAGGDLSKRLILPALFNLFLDDQLPQRFALLCIDRAEYSVESLSEHFFEAVSRYSRRKPVTRDAWQEFIACMRFLRTEISGDAPFTELKQAIAEQQAQWQGEAERVFYMATPPSLFIPISCALGNAGFAEERERARIVVEKPIGHDLDSFHAINRALCSFFSESQIYRIDHYLGKETVQNILALRFANPMFEPVWNRRYIDHVTITVAETLGVEKRGAYYEKAGALRDMVQNHLLQLLCLVAMEPPVAYDAEDIRGKKCDVLHALRPIGYDDVDKVAARGQYAEGWMEGKSACGYRDEDGVAARSNTETFAALKLQVDNWRWQDVPFYLRTGKRMAAKVSEISIRFRDVPHNSFPAMFGLNEQPARLVIQFAPEEGIILKFMAKEPGPQMRLRPVDMRFSYSEAFDCCNPDAYETLLRDVMVGDATLFMRADQVESAWRQLMPILEVWQANPAMDFPNYAAGTWGPESASILIARDGNSWFTPTLPNKPRGRS